MAEDRAKAEENVEELEKWARVRERGYAYPRVLLKLSGEALAHCRVLHRLGQPLQFLVHHLELRTDAEYDFHALL